jgi:hypothetical protein
MWSAGSVVALGKTFIEDICTVCLDCAAFMICTVSTGLQLSAGKRVSNRGDGARVKTGAA